MAVTTGRRDFVRVVRGLAAAVVALAGAGAAAQSTQAAGEGARQAQGDRALPPTGYGSLRHEDVAIQVRDQGLTIRAMPLDESVIRTLAPDSYQAMEASLNRVAPRLRAIAARLGLASVQAWHVQYFNVRQGEARFDPRGMQIRSVGRDFRPLDVIPLVPGFDEGRLAQGRSVDAIYVFDPAIALDQPLTVTLAGQQDASWSDIIPKLERERAAIWSRAAAARKPTDAGGHQP